MRLSRKRAILKRLAEVDPEDAERSNEALTEAFHFFDADGSGDISRHELLELLSVIHHRLSKKHISEAIADFTQESISKEDFLTVVEKLNALCQEYVRDHPEFVMVKSNRTPMRRNSTKKGLAAAEDSFSNIRFARRTSVMKEVACKSSVVNALGGMRRQSSTVQFADVAAAVDHSPPQIAEPEEADQRKRSASLWRTVNASQTAAES